jgi:hypothetical protein
LPHIVDKFHIIRVVLFVEQLIVQALISTPISQLDLLLMIMMNEQIKYAYYNDAVLMGVTWNHDQSIVQWHFELYMVVMVTCLPTDDM